MFHFTVLSIHVVQLSSDLPPAFPHWTSIIWFILPQNVTKKHFIRNSSSAQGSNTKNLTTEQRNQIIGECVDDHFSPCELAKKYSVPSNTIRAWIRKAGKTLPKTYKKSIYPTDGKNQRKNY